MIKKFSSIVQEKAVQRGQGETPPVERGGGGRIHPSIHPPGGKVTDHERKPDLESLEVAAVPARVLHNTETRWRGTTGTWRMKKSNPLYRQK